MSDMSRNVSEREEFWRPPAEARAERVKPAADDGACQQCHTEFVMGSTFCHVCGAERNLPRARRAGGLGRFFDMAALNRAFGLSTGSTICFFLGVLCVLPAMFVGIVYSANTVLDWQAVQVWRIEWLLAAVAAFVAGILLKRTSD